MYAIDSYVDLNVVISGCICTIAGVDQLANLHSDTLRDLAPRRREWYGEV